MFSLPRQGGLPTADLASARRLAVIVFLALLAPSFLQASGLALAGQPADSGPPSLTPVDNGRPSVVAQAAPAAPAAPPTGPANECDRLAAPPVALATPAAKANAQPVDWARAIEVCAAQASASPGEPRFQYELGRAYFQTKNYMEAVRHYKVAADAGYGQALSDLGIAYVQGFGVIKNNQTAFDLFNRAALAGNASGMQNVGSMYGNGLFVNRDNSKALEWYEKSIEAGNAGALGAAGVIYFNGDGGPPDYKVAAQYFQQAADLGDGFSLKFLAIMYERGLLGPADLEKAGALRAKAQEVDPDSQNPNVPLPQKVAPAGHANGAGGGVRHAGGGGGGGGSDSGCANTQFCTGTVHVNRWHGMATHLPRCWPFCTVQ